MLGTESASFLSVAMIKHSGEKQLRGKGVYAGSQSRSAAVGKSEAGA